MKNEIRYTRENENLEIIIETGRELNLITPQEVLDNGFVPVGEPALAVKPQGEEFWPKYKSIRHIIRMKIQDESIPKEATAITIGRLSRDKHRDLGKESPWPMDPVYLPVQFYSLGGK